MTIATRQRNPYIIGPAISNPKNFFGREKVFQFVEDNLKNGARAILLHGQRRIGKSSVLLQIPHFVADNEFVFIPFDLQDKGHLPLNRILHLLAETIVNRLKLTLDDMTVPTESELATDPSLFSQRFLPEIARRLAQKKLVLMLDEFDVLNSYDPAASVQSFFPYLQTLLSQHEHLFIIPVIGRQPDDLPKLLGLFREAPNRKIDVLSREDAEKLIAEPTKGALEYTQEAIEAILQLSQRHPYFTQLLCYALFVQAKSEQQQQVTPAAVERAVDEAMELGEGGLAWFRDGLPIPERVVFSAVSEAQERADASNDGIVAAPATILKQAGVVQTDALRQAETQLVVWDFLDLAAGSELLSETARVYRVKVELVRRWLVKYHPLRRAIWDLETLEPAAQSVYESALELQRYELLENAISLYEQVLTINPNHFNALFKLAEAYLETRDFSKAVTLYDRAYRIAPGRVREDYVESLQQYGLELLDRQKLEWAKQQFASILLIQPDHELAQEELREIEAHQERLNLRELDLRRFFSASNPSKTIDVADPEDAKYYIDLSPARGNPTERLIRTIARLSPDEATCQLFIGHAGCGKATELSRLKTELKKQGFHIIHLDFNYNLDITDIDAGIIFLYIARQITYGLRRFGFNTSSRYFYELFQFLSVESLEDYSLTYALDRLAIHARGDNLSPTRVGLRHYLSGLVQAINFDLIQPAIGKLKSMGKSLVIIVDGLDRLYDTPITTEHTSTEHLFIDLAELFQQLDGHVVYTLPLSLTFSREFSRLKNSFGTDPEVLSMVAVRLRDSGECDEGMALMRQLVLARAFPNREPEARLDALSEIFDRPETLDRLCSISGGHIRNVLRLLHRCLRHADLPITRSCLDAVIQQEGYELSRVISAHEWDLLAEVAQTKAVVGQEMYQSLVKSSFVFEYHYQDDRWFDLNPVLAELLEARHES